MDVEVDGLKLAAIDGCLAQRIDHVADWTSSHDRSLERTRSLATHDLTAMYNSSSQRCMIPPRMFTSAAIACWLMYL